MMALLLWFGIGIGSVGVPGACSAGRDFPHAENKPDVPETYLPTSFRVEI